MAETNKLNYGGDMLIFVNGTPIAFSKNSKLDISLKTRDVGSKDSGVWDEKAAGKQSWGASADGLMADGLIGAGPVIVTATAAITTGTATLTMGSATFVAGDVGKTVKVLGAGATGGDLLTTILAYVSATSVTLATNALTTLAATASKFIWVGGTLNAYSTLVLAMNTRQPIPIIFATATGTAPSWTVSSVAGKTKYNGNGFITSISMNAPDADTASFSISIEGTGELFQTNN